jgi:hypothetical protein
MGEYEQAAQRSLRSEEIRQQLAIRFFAAFSEAEALNFAAKNLQAPHFLLSAWQHTNRPADELYAVLWQRRGLIQRIMGGRQEAVQQAGTARVRELYSEYLDTRRRLSQLTLTPADADANRRVLQHRQMEQLTERKERLERELSDQVPEFAEQLAGLRAPFTDLTRRLPPDVAYLRGIHSVPVRSV